jgi:hypothetical protein
MIIFTDNYDLLKEKSVIDFERIVIIKDNNDKMKNLFRNPANNSHSLFNKNGEMIYTGVNSVGYERGIKIHLLDLIDNDMFNISDFMKQKNIHLNRNSIQISNLVHRSENKYLIVSLFTDFCDTCLSGYILHKINKIHLNPLDKTGTYAILYGNYYSKTDISILKSQSGYSFPILISNKALTDKWQKYISKYNDKIINNLIIFLDKKGYILDVFQKNTNNVNDYFDHIFEFIKMKGDAQQ